MRRPCIILTLSACATEPRTLSATGLYEDIESGELADGVIAYTPGFELWSDGATKKRWISVPEPIDTADDDAWSFPVGTHLWKEFSVDGLRVETRMLHKREDGWSYAVYAWNAEQTEAVRVEDGVGDALGSAHDIPATEACGSCHDNVPDAVLGFSAVQLNAGAPGLEALVRDGVLDQGPAVAVDVPGDERAVAALGVLHANCGSCHNPWTDSALDLWLAAPDLGAVEETAAYRTAVGQPTALDPLPGAPTTLIDPGSPTTSLLLYRMTARGEDWSMPPLATEEVDSAGSTAVSCWILGLAR